MHVIFAKPRGFCAGVERAIAIVEAAILRFGLPLYVKHAIVHNRHEVERLMGLGVTFVETIAEIPVGSRVILSAHGSSPACLHEAAERGLEVIDAVCPLVTKVHREVRRYAREGRTVLLIGHHDHVEVIGTMGEAPEQTIIVGSVRDAQEVSVPDPTRVAYTTQTTLSIDDTKEIVATLQVKFPQIVGPQKADICYATQNRQNAVRALAQRCDLIIIFGSPESSNANRLVEVAQSAGVPAFLVETGASLSASMLAGHAVIGVSSGASTPETLIEAARLRLREFGATTWEEIVTSEERVYFPLPGILQSSERGV